ncbi:hypothetical protein [Arthrobacter sp. FW306-04-A]|uniref:hypothetical protein n=1 Tax=Arthrobacter sp. FW306-04-A TaxID=2879619 RepID=UPI0037BEAAC0|nr:hypothetical protein LFT43_05890 [Arthrobacter sp. FW306-04-A]
MRKLSKKGKVYAVAASIALVAASGGAAFAYWSTTGSGSGTATNSSGNGTVTLSATFADGLTPGAFETINYWATNNTTSSTVVNLQPVAVTTNKTGCQSAWFTASLPSSSTTLAASATNVSIGTGTLTFLDQPGVDQNACKGAVITLTLAS